MTEAVDKADTESKTAPAPDNSSKAARSVAHALNNLSLVLDKNEHAYAVFKNELNPVAHRLRGQTVKKWLRKQAHSEGSLLKNDDLNEVIETLYAHAAADDDYSEVNLRIAAPQRGTIEIDIGSSDQHRVQLKDGKVQLVKSGAKTLFIRPSSMQPLPILAEDGCWWELLPYLNMSDEHQLLLVAWMTYCITHVKGASAYPILVLKGEQGSGKSLLCKLIIRSLIDPNSSGVQMFPRDIKELAISSQNQHVLMYDNLRSLSKQWSDALCVASTGGSLSSRKLYTNSEETVISLHTPLALNGIHHFIQEPDLASRCVSIQLERISASAREEESELTRRFKECLPSIYMGLLKLSAEILVQEPLAEVTHGERLMDFSRWLAAMEIALDKPSGELQQIYSRNIRSIMLDTVHENTLAMAVLGFATGLESGYWKGTPTELLNSLEMAADYRAQNIGSGWPQNSISLSKRLKVIQKALETQGITLEFIRSKLRQIEIRYRRPDS